LFIKDFEVFLMDLAVNYSYDNSDEQVRDNHIEVWSDLFYYAQNLKGNWLVSQEIFRTFIVPTAERNPLLFAKWVDDMVRISGLRIRSRALFARALKFIRRSRFLKKQDKNALSRALTELINAGLDEPVYAQRAIKTVQAG
jgi:hypothetical protein